MQLIKFFGALFVLFFSWIHIADAVSLQDDIAALAKSPNLNAQQTSIFAVDLETGKVLASHNPNLLLNPASCAKLFTASAALATLGPNHRFKTHFYSSSEPHRGEIQNLYIKGEGDPFLVSEQLWRMVRMLHHQGVRKVSGNIVIDKSFFDDSFPGQLSENKRAYAAATSAVSVNFNSLTIVVHGDDKAGSPAFVSIEPASAYTELKANVSTGSSEAINVDSSFDGKVERITVSGTIPAGKEKLIYRNVEDPSLYAGQVIKNLLAQNDIQVLGNVSVGKTPESAYLLRSEDSKPLALLVRDMDKFSNNFTAEQIIKHLGAVKEGTPGTTEKGMLVVKNYLRSIGLPMEKLHLANGSGLSEDTKISAEQLVAVLSAAYRNFATQADLLASLAILGVDGTMHSWKMHDELKGLVRAKTGSLSSSSSLAGFVPMKNGHVAAFAIVTNGLKTSLEQIHHTQIDIVAALANNHGNEP